MARSPLKTVLPALPGQMRLVPVGRSAQHPGRKPVAMPFREITRAEGYVMARQGDDMPWVFEVAEWEGYRLIAS